jgi:hypothetical protein
MTGTPLDITPFGPLLSWLGFSYWLLALALAAFAVWVARRWWIKVPAALAIFAAFVYPVVTHKQEQTQQYDAAKAKLDAAMAHFEMRCKSAGEKITRTVENVEGVVWIRWRDKDFSFNDQFKLDDPLGKDCGAEECIAQLLRVTVGQALDPERASRYRVGYSFVESRIQGEGALMRYARVITSVRQRTKDEIEQYKKNTNGIDPGPDIYDVSLDSRPISVLTARYGITWDDVSTRADREHWVAGSSLKVIDLQSNEVIAERIGFLVDTGQGSTAGFRTPWGWAKTYAPRCPRTNESTRDFALKVLQPLK